MKSLIAIVSMLLFVFAAQVLGLAYGTEEAAANDSINATQLNETISNETLTNETLINGTLENASLAQNESESDPFANAKNRKPSSR